MTRNDDLAKRVEEIATAMQASYQADIDLLTRRDKAHMTRIAYLEQTCEVLEAANAKWCAVPVDDIEYIIATHFFQVERGQDEHLDRINVWLDQVKPTDDDWMFAHAPDPEPLPPDPPEGWDEDDDDVPHYDTPGGY